MIQKLIIPPDRNSYNFLDGEEVLSVALDGGASKFRSDVLNSNIRVSVQWTLNPTSYNYFRAFYNTIIAKGALPFLIDLYIDNPFELTEHEAHFVPGTFGLRSQSGQAFVIAATLEIKPIAMTQENIDAGLLFGLFGEEYIYYNNLFDNIINVQIPADLA